MSDVNPVLAFITDAYFPAEISVQFMGSYDLDELVLFQLLTIAQFL